MQEQTTGQAKALYDAGELGPALEALTREVKANPADQRRRSFLFELLCFAGEWERAGKQLDVMAHQSASAEVGVQVYRNCIRAELARRRLFADGLAPHFLTEPPPHVDLHLEAINRLRGGDPAAARETLDRAEEQRPALAGTLNGRPFHDFRDYDDFIGPVMELIVLDKYTWLPFEQVRRVRIEPPSQLRDLVWVAASIETAETEMKAFMPALYVNSGAHPDDLVRLGRMTDWKQLADELYVGAGLRLLAVDGEERPALDLREVEFTPPGGEAAPATPADTDAGPAAA